MMQALPQSTFPLSLSFRQVDRADHINIRQLTSSEPLRRAGAIEFFILFFSVQTLLSSLRIYATTYSTFLVKWL
jgi:hypothetical protein